MAGDLTLPYSHMGKDTCLQLSISTLFCVVAGLCYFVYSSFRDEKTPCERRNNARRKDAMRKNEKTTREKTTKLKFQMATLLYNDLNLDFGVSVYQI